MSKPINLPPPLVSTFHTPATSYKTAGFFLQLALPNQKKFTYWREKCNASFINIHYTSLLLIKRSSTLLFQNIYIAWKVNSLTTALSLRSLGTLYI